MKAEEMCQKLKIDEGKLRSFLKKAVFITGQQQHDEYSIHPCYIEATVIKGDKKIKLKIWDWITGDITYSNGKTKFIADKAKQDKPDK